MGLLGWGRREGSGRHKWKQLDPMSQLAFLSDLCADWRWHAPYIHSSACRSSPDLQTAILTAPDGTCIVQPSWHCWSCLNSEAKVFDGLTLLCIVVFVLEIVLCMFAKDPQIWQIYFFRPALLAFQLQSNWYSARTTTSSAFSLS